VKKKGLQKPHRVDKKPWMEKTNWSFDSAPSSLIIGYQFITEWKKGCGMSYMDIDDLKKKKKVAIIHGVKTIISANFSFLLILSLFYYQLI
jgi:hypothetical protein